MDSPPNKKMSTYTPGFRVKVRDINYKMTQDGMVRLCRALEKSFGEGNVFEPESMSDGFILWVSWPGMDPSKYAYKCMRMFGRNLVWPFVDSDAMTSWVGKRKVIFGKGEYDTSLKAFGEAPIWTIDELKTIKECMESCCNLKVMCMPKKDDLTFRG